MPDMMKHEKSLSQDSWGRGGQVANLTAKGAVVAGNVRKWLFLLLVAAYTVSFIIDFVTTRIYPHSKIEEVVNNSASNVLIVQTPINPEAPVDQHKYTTQKFGNEARWSDLSFDENVIETISNTVQTNNLPVTIAVSWNLWSKNDPNLNNIFVESDPDGLVDAVINQRWPWSQYWKPDTYLRNYGGGSFPWVVVYGTMIGGWLFLVGLTWLVLYRGWPILRFIGGKSWNLIAGSRRA